MTIYLGIYSGFCLLALTVRRHGETLMLAALCLFLLLFMGTRYETGCDFSGYLNRFEALPPGVALSEALGGDEFGFQLILTAVRSLDGSYMWVNVIATAILLINVFLFIRKRHQPVMILAVFFPILLIQLGMSGLRQGIAVSFLLLACNGFVEGSRIRTAGWILMGSIFHLSVLLFFPLVGFVGRRVSGPRIIAAIVILTPLTLFLLGDRIDVYRARYIDQIYGQTSSGAALIRYGVTLLPFVPFFIYRKVMEVNFPRDHTLIVLFGLLTLAVLPVALINTVALHRLTYYLMPISIVMFVYLSYAMALLTKQRILRLAPAVLYGGYSVSWFALSHHADICYTPYQSYLLL